jgi:hypothetical protein
MDSMLSLSEAKKYLSDKMKRPLWYTEKDVVDPLYTPLCNSEESFNSSLYQHFKRSLGHDDGNLLFPKTFLDDFAAHRNRPNIPDGYVFENSLSRDGRNCIFKLNAFLGENALGLPVLDKGGRQRVAYPSNLIDIALASEPGTNSSEIVSEYGQYLETTVQTTGACMDVSSSLALERERFDTYMDSLTQLEPS